MANEAAGVYPGLFSLRVKVAKASIALVDALPQELLHLTLEDLEYSTVCFGRFQDAQGTEQVDHAAQLPLPAFRLPGDACPLRRLLPFRRHPCWVVESAGVVMLEELVAEPPVTRRASRTVSGRNLPARTTAAAAAAAAADAISLRAVPGGAPPPWDVHTVLRYGDTYYRNVDTSATKGAFESLSLSLLELQLDNQTMHPSFPVVLGPMRQSDPWRAASKAAVVRVHQQRNLTLPGLDYFTHLDVHVEPLALCIDETLLRDVLHFAEGAGLLEGLLEGAAEGSDQPHEWEWSLVAPLPSSARASKVVFDQLRISRISIDLSLRTAAWSKSPLGTAPARIPCLLSH